MDGGLATRGWRFVPGRFLAQPGRRIPRPEESSKYDPFAFGFRDESKRFADELGLPISVELYADAQLLTNAADRARRSGTETKMVGTRGLAPRGKPRTTPCKYSYIVESFTNVAGWSVPLQFIAIDCYYGDGALHPETVIPNRGKGGLGRRAAGRPKPVFDSRSKYPGRGLPVRLRVRRRGPRVLCCYQRNSTVG